MPWQDNCKIFQEHKSVTRFLVDLTALTYIWLVLLVEEINLPQSLFSWGPTLWVFYPGCTDVRLADMFESKCTEGLFIKCNTLIHIFYRSYQYKCISVQEERRFMVALVLAIDKVTYTIFYCVINPECNLKLAREILKTNQ